MTYEEIKQMLSASLPQKSQRRHSEEEHRIQCSCVKWFRLAYAEHRHNLFAVPNGGRRDKTTAAKLKAEGVLAGVADLILLIPNGQFHALLIEMKTRTGTQQATQKEWQRCIETYGYKYVVCRSLEDFQNEINNYLCRQQNSE